MVEDFVISASNTRTYSIICIQTFSLLPQLFGMQERRNCRSADLGGDHCVVCDFIDISGGIA